MKESHAAEIASGERFTFGRNWLDFARRLDEDRIEASVTAFRAFLDTEDLAGTSVLDLGSGSGLSSLAARRLGARVVSFDFDPDSVACTRSVRQRFAPDDTDADWSILRGSVLDADFMAGLDHFDLVYSWGVLHHTGAMWQAVANAADRVAPGGRLWLALYNDQGAASQRWTRVKRAYNRNRALRGPILLASAIRLWGPTVLRDTLRLRPLATLRQRAKIRGMSPWHDIVDWVGGYPFEVASCDEVHRRLADLGFAALRTRSIGRGRGCNEFLFTRRGSASSRAAPSGPPSGRR